MDLYLSPASASDLKFARDLTRRGMLAYYTRFDLLWQETAFDLAWQGRENLIVQVAGERLGYLSLSRDLRALYIRELHLLEAARGQGLGSAVLHEVQARARSEHFARVRLTVFKTNPARHLYQRHGFVEVGEEACFWRMEQAIQR
ncbi:GNAT family N-acetyltransferase [Pseudomonas sp. nanlin1]|uniref:GNAT family N-acetyltransferase n=1 Tax=Pseudomonas sp. nanlin1 TaxID=3040605 RepID=UPI00388DDF34